jgi:hypothetical protein
MAVKSLNPNSDGWQPSVKYLLVLLVAEIVVFGVLRSITNHGG